MKKRTALIFLMIVAITAAVFGLAACSTTSADFSSYTPVKFVFNYDNSLDGGRYQNSRNPITHYYDLGEDEEILISNPEELGDISNTGHSLEGWYTDLGYTRKWDFERDTLKYDPGTPFKYDTAEGKVVNPDEGHGLILYAHWVPNLRYSFEMYYIEDGEEIWLGTYEDVAAGSVFWDYLGYGRRSGYTVVRYYDENGETIPDQKYPHPGGEVDTAIKVYVEYIEGNYTIASSASTLKLTETANIYLLNDIDLGGASISSLFSYSGHFNGAGHTIKNFKLSYSSANFNLREDADLANANNPMATNILGISLFGTLNGATIENVTFENATIDVNTDNSQIRQIIVSPLALKISKSTLSNVKFSGNYTVTKLPKNFNAEANLSFAEDMYYFKAAGDTSVVENCEFGFTQPEATVQAMIPITINYSEKKKSKKETA